MVESQKIHIKVKKNRYKQYRVLKERIDKKVKAEVIERANDQSYSKSGKMVVPGLEISATSNGYTQPYCFCINLIYFFHIEHL